MKSRPASPNSGHEGTVLPQIDKFRELARELGADEDEKAFEDKVKKVAGSEPPKPKQKPDDA